MSRPALLSILLLTSAPSHAHPAQPRANLAARAKQVAMRIGEGARKLGRAALSGYAIHAGYHPGAHPDALQIAIDQQRHEKR
jgi:hypothetical protein